MIKFPAWLGRILLSSVPGHPPPWVEAVALLGALAAALLLARSCRGALRRLAPAADALAARRGAALAVVGAVSLAVSALLTLRQYPQPAVNDEFSYLLAADTFAHGRLANPPHPLGIHFETPHVILQPTYASKYPPGQGLALALGQVLTGHPIAGVWLSVALACVAIAWMLYAWVPARWALAGGLLAALHPRLLEWGHSYWGGAVAAIGGALVYGALRRILREPRARDALGMGLGLAILANSRPFEGLVVSLPAGAALLAWGIGRAGARAPAAVRFRRVGLPLAAVLAAAVAGTAAYDRAVTGDALRMPFQVHAAQYDGCPQFFFLRPFPPPLYNHRTIEAMHAYFARWHRQVRDEAPMMAEMAAGRLFSILFWYVRLAWLPALLVLPGLWRGRWTRFALLACGLTAAAHLTTLGLFTHYTAPMTGLAFVLLVCALRRVRAARRRARLPGRALARAMLAASVIAVPASFAGLTADPAGWNFERARIAERLGREEGRHLVIVRYAPDHNPHSEWVYNGADIDGSKVAWAREMDPERNRRLLEYFKDRKAWLLEADAGRLVPYAEGGPPP